MSKIVYYYKLNKKADRGKREDVDQKDGRKDSYSIPGVGKNSRKYVCHGGKNDVVVKGKPTLMDTSTLKCAFGGTIKVSNPGQQLLSE